MERFLFLFVHLGLPLIILCAASRIRPKSWFALISNTALYLLVLTFLYFWGQWALAASLYFKYAVLAIGVFALWKGYRRIPKIKATWPIGFWRWFRAGVAALLALLFALLADQILQGRSYPEESTALVFPLKEGSYFISLGGSNRTINNHYGTSTTAQWYALDVNKLGEYGMATSTLWGTANEEHYIFGEPVYAPCSGRVLEVKTGVPDNAGASMEVGPEDGMGNYVVLDCKGLIITMVHLQNSIPQDTGGISEEEGQGRRALEGQRIQKGQYITVGDFLGRVGNSGFSQEPHLHFQAARYIADSTLIPVPMRFGKKVPVRGDVMGY